jgi:hypothetical protein
MGKCILALMPGNGVDAYGVWTEPKMGNIKVSFKHLYSQEGRLLMWLVKLVRQRLPLIDGL